jgi:hypothetical protein
MESILHEFVFRRHQGVHGSWIARSFTAFGGSYAPASIACLHVANLQAKPDTLSMLAGTGLAALE